MADSNRFDAVTKRQLPTRHPSDVYSTLSSSSGKCDSNNLRRGYTLLELMLVLAILLVMAGLAWPRVEGMYERHRLKKAAEDVRLHLAGCRLRALDQGVIYQFRYQPGGQTYDVAPLLVDSTTGVAAAVLSATLPEAMTFEPAPGTLAAGMTGGATSSFSLAGAPSSTSVVPILFLPDGTADETTLDVVDGQGRRVRLSVRGLTSAVTLAYEGREGRL